MHSCINAAHSRKCSFHLLSKAMFRYTDHQTFQEVSNKECGNAAVFTYNTFSRSHYNIVLYLPFTIIIDEVRKVSIIFECHHGDEWCFFEFPFNRFQSLRKRTRTHANTTALLNWTCSTEIIWCDTWVTRENTLH